MDYNELPFSTAEFAYFQIQMKKYKVPILYKIVFGSLYKFGAIFMPVLFTAILTMGIIQASSNIDLWAPLKILAFVFIFGIGGLVLISFLWHRLKVLKECRRLGLTLKQWNLLAIAFQIKYI